MNKFIAIMCSFLALGACTGKTGDSSASNTEQVKLEQYLVEGRTLYLQYCSACHQADGKGLAQLYPPLNGSDYLNDNH